MSIPSPDRVSRVATADDGLIAASIYDDNIKAPLLGKDGATVATSVVSDDRDAATSAGETTAVKPTKSQLTHLVGVGIVTTAAVAATVSQVAYAC